MQFFKTLSLIFSKKDTKKYGWKRDLPDNRDKKFTLNLPAILPKITDLRSFCPPVYNQGQIGSCTANAIGAAIQYDQRKQHPSQVFTPSRLFIYYFERLMEGTVGEDSGAMIRDGIKVVNSKGVCSEITWPYSTWRMYIKPSNVAQKEAVNHRAIQYQKLDNTNLNQLKSCIAGGYPFVFGFSVYDYFESAEMAKTGILKLPEANESVLGGHAVLCCGYNDNTQMFTIRNSWGDTWGDKGYFYMPYSYMTNLNLASDFWTIKSVS